MPLAQTGTGTVDEGREARGIRVTELKLSTDVFRPTNSFAVDIRFLTPQFYDLAPKNPCSGYLEFDDDNILLNEYQSVLILPRVVFPDEWPEFEPFRSSASKLVHKEY